MDIALISIIPVAEWKLDAYEWVTASDKQIKALSRWQ